MFLSAELTGRGIPSQPHNYMGILLHEFIPAGRQVSDSKPRKKYLFPEKCGVTGAIIKGQML
jgi:hypothetical protein